jgi:hypothetical protein
MGTNVINSNLKNAFNNLLNKYWVACRRNDHILCPLVSFLFRLFVLVTSVVVEGINA